MSEIPVPVLYLDLDGTVRHDVDDLGHFVNAPEDVIIFPEAVVMMRRWKEEKGGRIVGVSNQGGIAMGHMTEDQCVATMDRTQELADGLFELIVWCPHHPEASDPLKARCFCRKPSPGMLIMAAANMEDEHPGEIYPPHLALMVGDRHEDQQCARLACVDFMRAAEWRAQAATEG